MVQVKKSSADEFVQTKEFLTFTQTWDFLQFSLDCQKNESLAPISGPIDLNPFFPKASCDLHYLDKGMLLAKAKENSSPYCLIISVGIHGNETAPIEIVRDQLRDIFQGNLEVRLPILFIFGHLEAMILAKRQVEENLNRVFFTSKSHQKLKPRSLEAIRALEIMDQVKSFVELYGKDKTLVHYDLHTAIRKSKIEKFCVHPFVDKREFGAEQFHFLSSMGVEATLFSRAYASTFSCYSANEFLAQSFTVELGAVARFGQNDLSRFSHADRALRELYQEGSYEKMEKSSPPRAFEVVRTLVRRHEKFKLTFSEDLPNFSSFKKGEAMMEDGDEIHIAQSDGERIVFPNSKVGIGERVALIVKERA